MVTKKDIGKKVIYLRKEYILKDVYEDDFCRLRNGVTDVFCHQISVKLSK